jgi:hypothetical protein
MFFAISSIWTMARPLLSWPVTTRRTCTVMVCSLVFVRAEINRNRPQIARGRYRGKALRIYPPFASRL